MPTEKRNNEFHSMLHQCTSHNLSHAHRMWVSRADNALRDLFRALIPSVSRSLVFTTFHTTLGTMHGNHIRPIWLTMQYWTTVLICSRLLIIIKEIVRLLGWNFLNQVFWINAIDEYKSLTSSRKEGQNVPK